MSLLLWIPVLRIFVKGDVNSTMFEIAIANNMSRVNFRGMASNSTILAVLCTHPSILLVYWQAEEQHGDCARYADDNVD
jgi:hypothetical protein